MISINVPTQIPLKERKSLRKVLRDYDKTKNDEIWKSRYQYLQIIESFINRSIDIDELIHKFNDLRGSNMKASKIQGRSFFAGGKLYTIIDLFDPDVTFAMNLKNPESVRNLRFLIY